jgi:hypothetical protein
MNSKTASSIPGWYVEFQTNVLKNLPRPPLLSQQMAEEWNKNGANLKRSLTDLIIPQDKEIKMIDWGRFTVPPDYDHNTILARFAELHKDWYPNYSTYLTDENFSNVSAHLVPGKEYFVKIFDLGYGSATRRNEDIVDFLKRREALFVGAQGMVAVFEYCTNNRDGDRGYGPLTYKSFVYSLDVRENLWMDPVGLRNIPRMHGRVQGSPEFTLEQWKENQSVVHTSFLCVTECNEEITVV